MEEATILIKKLKEDIEAAKSNFKTECIECGETVTVKETLHGVCTKCMANGLMGP